MTIQELIDRLQDFDPNAEVRLMTQENWPFQNSIRGICDARDLRDEDECDCAEAKCPCCNPDEPDEVAYIVEGSQLGYGNKNAWNIAG